MDDARPLATGPPDTHRADPLGQVRRHWWLVALLAAAGLGAAAQVTAWLPVVYEASTSVMVGSTSGGPGTGAGRGPDINLDTEAQLVTSTAVATRAAGLLHSTAPPAALAAGVGIQVPANTSVLVITFDAAHAHDAQAGSRAFAQAYLGNRTDSAQADLAGRVAVLTGKVNQLNTSLAQVNAAIAGTGARNPDRANLDTQRSTIVSQINTLTNELDDLSTTTVQAGQVIQDADLPTTPVRPDRPLNLACGLLAGLVLGAGSALGRERLGTRVYAADALRRVDVPVIANIPIRKYALDAVFAPGDTAGRAFDRLRNEVVARMPATVGPIARLALTAASSRAAGDPGGAPSGQTIVVTGASNGVASAVVAANLAAAFARTGAETVVVSARLDDGPEGVTSLDRVLGVQARPGLSDVLDGQVSLRRAIQRAPGYAYLHVVAAGDGGLPVAAGDGGLPVAAGDRGSLVAAGGRGSLVAGGDRGLVQSPALPDILATLRARGAYVVVEAPSTAISADAQSLASLADAALVAVELRRTRYAEVRDAADQLRRIGTPMLGVVALPRLTGSS